MNKPQGTSLKIEDSGNTIFPELTICPFEERGKFFWVEKEPRLHPSHGMVITCKDDDGYRFTTSVKNIRVPQDL